MLFFLKLFIEKNSEFIIQNSEFVQNYYLLIVIYYLLFVFTCSPVPSYFEGHFVNTLSA